MESTNTPPATPVPEPKRSLFETIVTATPVLLTVIATFMVGQSSSEMTRAQYFRAVASQNQSKVGDQWSFFQAKRIRGQILEGNADQLLSQPRNRFTRQTLVRSAQELVTETDAMGAGDELKTLHANAEKTLAATKAAMHPSADGWTGERHKLTEKRVQATFDALDRKPVTSNKDDKKAETDEAAETISPEQTAMLNEVLADIKARKTGKEIAPKVLKLSPDTIEKAIKDADARADATARRGKAIDNVLEEFDALLDRQMGIAFDFQVLVDRLKSGPEKEELQRRADRIRTVIAKVQGDYKAASHAFSGRRYEDDARSNQDSAFLYEAQVQLSAALSDKHLYRSRLFMLAMLVAQAGVTIATLAMAVKQKSVIWLLATLTGLISIAFGAYVYLDLWPVPGF